MQENNRRKSERWKLIAAAAVEDLVDKERARFFTGYRMTLEISWDARGPWSLSGDSYSSIF